MERVVIARLDVDESGAVRSVKATEAAVGSLEKQTKATADVFTHRMFSMKEAARALLGGFTLAGVAIEMKNFATEIAKTDTAFAQFSESVKAANKEVQDFFRPFVHEALIQAANGINAMGRAFTSFFSTFRSGYDSLGAKGKAAFWTLAAILGGKTGAGFAKSMLGLGGDTRLEDSAGFIGPPQHALQQGIYSPTSPLGSLANPALAVRVPETGGFDPEQMKWLDDLHEKTQALTGDTLDLRDAWLAMPDALRKFMDTGQAMQDETLTPLQKNLKALQDYIKETSLGFEVATAAAQGFATALTDAAQSGSLTAKKFLGTIIEAVGQAIIAYGTLIMAEGFASWNPARIAIGAGYIAAGVATMTIGSRMASAGSSAGSASGAIGSAGSPQPSTPQQNVNVAFNIEGHMIGNQQFMRDATIWIKRALADGSAGGALA